MPLANRIEQTPHGFKGEPARLIPSIADNALERRSAEQKDQKRRLTKLSGVLG